MRKGCLIVLAVLLPALSARAAEPLLETIIVTASRSAEAASQLGVAWTALSGDSIDLTRMQHSNQLLQRVPGAWISRGNGQESLISLRSPVLTGAGSCGAFLTAEDSIPLRSPGFCNVNQLFDANLLQAAQLEVLRGPDSGVYGANAMHGIINVMTRSAATSRNTLRLEGGSRDFYRGSVSVGSERTGLALDAQATTYGGFQTESGYEQQKATLRWDGEQGEWATTALLSASHLAQETAGFIQGFRAYEDPALQRQNPNPEAYRDARTLRGYVRGERDVSGDQRLSLTLYARDNRMTFLQHFLPWQATEDNGHRSVGLQSALSGARGDLDWRGGVDVDLTRGWLVEDQNQPFSLNQPQGTHYDYSVDAVNAAAFTQLRYQLSADWQVSAAARLELTHYDYDNRVSDGSACSPAASACRFFRPADRRDDFRNWTGNLSLIRSYGAHQWYGRVARGYRPPQTAELYRLQGGQLVADIESESIASIETGLRGQLFERLDYSLNAYWMDKQDVIFQNADRFNISGAETEHVGIEVEARWQLDDHWRAELTATAAHHRYGNDAELIDAGSDIDGNVIDTAPRHFGSARLRGDFAPRGMPVTAELEYVWTDGYFLEPDNEHRYEGHSLVNLRATLDVNADWEVSAVITNLTDRDYAERADFAFGQYRYFVGEPRSLLLGISRSL